YPLFSASANGTLAYVSGRAGSPGRLTWFDRGGRSAASIDPADGSEWLNPALSPEGDRLAVNRMDPVSGNWDVWILDLARNVSTRLTVNPAQDTDPVWSPDGTRVVFASTRDGHPALYAKNVEG